MQITPFVYTLLLVVSLSACKKSSGDTSNTTPPVVNSSFIKGADISWLTQMEAAGYKFYTAGGTAMDGMQLMQSLGINTIRLRVWVNPANGWCNNSDLVAKAKRAKQLGLRIMLDIHYSDVWADPGHQAKPAAWAAFDFATLKTTVTSYTKSVLDTMKLAGVVPGWVQVGNETNDGMLWPDGKASVNMANFAALVNAGYQAVKAVSDTIKVIVHISNGYDNTLFRWMFDGLKTNGASWDIIGMSLYPTSANWQSYNASCLANMNDMVSRYNKPVMICEVGMPVTDAAVCQSFLTDLISKTKSVTGNNGLGVLYWEPECYNNWQGYGLGAFDNTGKPTVAMSAFGN
ncbi:MAG TPA: glycosyl hydrolase 53 family protein [Chitinophagaceae bacterium]|nr:glycosyl hydrolase 53 family protein [Chitinophagaceae bacterium]